MRDHRFRETGDGNLAFQMKVEFSNNSTTIDTRFSKDILDAAQFLKENPLIIGVVEGHTDNVGSESFNMKLSEARAEAVRETLINTYGIAAERVLTKGFGETRPVAENTTEEGRERNRRVELFMNLNAVDQVDDAAE
jgi:OOP family OmpA-OmpF porin